MLIWTFVKYYVNHHVNNCVSIAMTEPSTTAELSSLAAGLSSMPEFDANLDDSQSDLHDHTLSLEDEVVAAISAPEKQSAAVGEIMQPAEPIHFVSSHFKDDSSEDDEAKLGEGLSFPDVQDGPTPDLSFALSPEHSETISQTIASAFTSPLVSQTVSSLMTSTVAGLSSIKDSVAAVTRQETDHDIAGANSQSGNQEPSLLTSVDTDILDDEFEFLDQQDLDSLDIDNADQNPEKK